MKHFTIPVFIPELACPFQCIFCNQRKITDRLYIPPAEEVTGIIERNLSTIDTENSCVEIGFFGGNFTGIDPMEQERLLKAAHRYILDGRVSSLRVSTRPDYINEENLKMLKAYGVGTIELGAQSMCDEVLIASGRGHKVSDTIRASEMIRKEGFSLGLQMMIGLPKDSRNRALETAERIIHLGASNTRIYPALVIRDTKMEQMYISGKYTPLSLEEAVEWTKDIYLLFEKAGVQIIRVGLHPSEGLLDGSAYLAGPFHISFRELVLSAIWKDMLKNEFTQRSVRGDRLTLHVAPGQVNYAAGYKGENRRMLQGMYRSVKILTDAALKGREFYADNC